MNEQRPEEASACLTSSTWEAEVGAPSPVSHGSGTASIQLS